MLPLFKKSISATEVAEMLGQFVVNWPAKNGAQFKASFQESTDKDIQEVLDEMVYFFGFGTDYAIYSALNESPKTMEALRSAFVQHLERYALEHQCRPVPPGGWLDDGWIWLPQGPAPEELGNPLNNLKNRLTLYADALKRPARQKVSVAEAVAHLLAGWCDILDITFLASASSYFSGYVIADCKLLKRLRIKI